MWAFARGCIFSHPFRKAISPSTQLGSSATHCDSDPSGDAHGERVLMLVLKSRFVVKFVVDKGGRNETLPE